jgi:putative acetyltransferase
MERQRTTAVERNGLRPRSSGSAIENETERDARAGAQSDGPASRGDVCRRRCAPKVPSIRFAARSGNPAMKIELDDLSRPAVHALLNEHLQDMYELSPPESVHALDLEELRRPEITFWTAWDGPLLLGCGALMELDRRHGEVKSMRTPSACRRKGAGRAVLAQMIGVARSRSYERLSLETGSMEAFKPAQRLYESLGFGYCGPFGDYSDDPNSVFMTLHL